MRKALRLSNTNALKPYILYKEKPAGYSALTPYSSEADIDDRIRSFATTINYSVSSAAMGKVVDSELRVIRVRGLRIGDASVFPALVSVAP